MNEITFFAQIDDNNICQQVHVVSSEFMAENPDRYPGIWVETFYNDPNKTYAGEGYIYDPQTKDFSQPPYYEL